MANNARLLDKLSKSVADIKNSFITSKDYSAVDAEINRSIDKLLVSDLNSNVINYAETMKQYITKNIDSSSISKEITAGILNTPETMARYSRYVNADEIIYNIPQCGRALRVLASGIMSPDNVTKSSLTISSSDLSEGDEVKEILNNLKIINKEIKFEDYLDNIITETLKYGDKFIEICSYKSKEIPITQSMYLEEKMLYEESGRVGKPPKKIYNKNYTIEYTKILSETPNEFGILPTKKVKTNVTLNLVEDIKVNDVYNINSKQYLSESKRNKKDNEKLYENIEEIRLIQHDPRHVIKLQTDRFKVNLGYLILPDGSEANIGMTLGGASSGGLANSTATVPLASGLYNDVFQGIDSLYKDLIKMVKRHVNREDIKVNKKEVKQLLARLISDLEDDSEKKELKIRYVPPERMEHFQINERINFPYGEGIFEKSMHMAKELIALKTAVTVRRITDSVDKRVIYIEANLPRQSKNLVALLKEALRKRKFSIGNLSNISTIPTMMTNFEEYIITTKNGKRSVEFDTIPTTSSIRDITEELKFFRDELVSSLDVPPAFIGIEENINGKSTLAHESAIFADTILSYQKIFNIHLFRIFNSLHKLLYGKAIPDSITISLPSPKMLFIGNELDNLENMARIMELSTSLDVQKDTLKRKYLSFDWDEEEETKTREELRKRSEPSKKSDDDMFGMGGMGGGMIPPAGGIGMGM